MIKLRFSQYCGDPIARNPFIESSRKFMFARLRSFYICNLARMRVYFTRILVGRHALQFAVLSGGQSQDPFVSFGVGKG